ncbi:uncharacterized protein CXorf49 homolog [Oryctolagus cuniculus]|uniref:Uncharacterized protein n=1 Tax=Oryctolagus cuniculus TaxID=9986 RepID=G1TPW1_RABIT|nr:uncharacterized protein CXorf49 homolog [Oryctolagus cuniculus]
MSAHSKASGFSDRISLRSREQEDPGGPGTPRSRVLGLDLIPAGSGEGQGQGQNRGRGRGESGPSSLQALKRQLESESESESQLEMFQEGAAVLRDCEARPKSPTTDRQGAVGPAVQFAEACAAILEPLSVSMARGLPGVGRGATEAAAAWAPVKASISGRGGLGLSCAESLQRSAAPRPVSAFRKGRDQGHSKTRSARRRLIFTTDEQRTGTKGWLQLPSDSESSDEFWDVQPLRVSPRLERRDRTKDHSSEEPPESPIASTSHGGENFPHISVPFLTSTLQGLTKAMEMQGMGELGPSSSKKVFSGLPGKRGGSPTHPGVPAAPAGSLPQATSRKKEAKEKKPLVVCPEFVLGSAFAPWGQRASAAPGYPVTFPKIPGISLLEEPDTSFSLPWVHKQSQQGDTGKDSAARRKSQPVAADRGPDRDPDSGAQFPADKPGTPCKYVPGGEFSSGERNRRQLQDSENLEASSLSQGSVTPRGPALSNDQEPPVRPRRPARQQLPPGIEGCSRRTMLQKEVHDLREQLAVVRSLTEKFRKL